MSVCKPNLESKVKSVEVVVMIRQQVIRTSINYKDMKNQWI